MGRAIGLEKSDVTVEEIFDECDNCTGGPATHTVKIDFRNAGMAQELGRYCESCAEEVADRIRASLPESHAEVPR